MCFDPKLASMPQRYTLLAIGSLSLSFVLFGRIALKALSSIFVFLYWAGTAPDSFCRGISLTGSSDNAFYLFQFFLSFRHSSAWPIQSVGQGWGMGNGKTKKALQQL